MKATNSAHKLMAGLELYVSGHILNSTAKFNRTEQRSQLLLTTRKTDFGASVQVKSNAR